MNNIKPIVYWISIVVLISGIVLFCSRPRMGQLPATKELVQNQLDEERQTLWINMDSLNTWLEPLQQQTNAFEYEFDESKLKIQSLDEKAFNAIFLNYRSVAAFAELKDPILVPLKKGYGFEAEVEEKSKIKFVHLPAEVIQSIQLFRKNQSSTL